MGYETSYQAIPADRGLIELARSSAEIAVDVAMIPYWFSRAPRRPTPENRGDKVGWLWSWCRELAARYPGLGAMNCSLDRRWDVLHYLLSATRRGEPATRNDLVIDRAFDAGELISEYARAGQGVPVRYLDGDAAREVAEVVGPLVLSDLEAHFRPARLEASRVYKFRAERADEAEWRLIGRYLDEFRGFFSTVAAAGHGVIVVRD